MQPVRDEKFIYNAINSCDSYTKSQKLMLNTFLKLEIADIVTLAVTSIQELTGASKPVIYKNIARLKKDNIIELLKNPGDKLAVFKINRDKLKNIEELYLKRLSLQKI